MLAMRANAAHMEALREHGSRPIDMVVVNLYEFEKMAAKPGVTFEELIENIDIGGPTMIRGGGEELAGRGDCDVGRRLCARCWRS